MNLRLLCVDHRDASPGILVLGHELQVYGVGLVAVVGGDIVEDGREREAEFRVDGRSGRHGSWRADEEVAHVGDGAERFQAGAQGGAAFGREAGLEVETDGVHEHEGSFSGADPGVKAVARPVGGRLRGLIFMIRSSPENRPQGWAGEPGTCGVQLEVRGRAIRVGRCSGRASAAAVCAPQFDLHPGVCFAALFIRRTGRVRYLSLRMKLVSWNVNGIRAVLNKGLLDWIKREQADIVCFQETKAREEQVAVVWPDGYEAHWHSAERPGYSGVLTLTRHKPLSTTRGMGALLGDNEGRVLTVELPEFFLVNCYTPNAKRELERLEYRHREWDPAFLKHLKQLERKKPVVFCGDLNVAHTEIDLANPKANVRTHGFTIEEREGFSNLVSAGFVDTFRVQHPGEGGHYTWWSVMTNARARNIGWRIDYFGLSAALHPRLKRAFIEPEVKGSDHCPVGIELA